jgi:hypothetical protein
MSMQFAPIEILGPTCPCGARRDKPKGRCRKCRARSAWLRHNTRHRNSMHARSKRK